MYLFELVLPVQLLFIVIYIYIYIYIWPLPFSQWRHPRRFSWLFRSPCKQRVMKTSLVCSESWRHHCFAHSISKVLPVWGCSESLGMDSLELIVFLTSPNRTFVFGRNDTSAVLLPTQMLFQANLTNSGSWRHPCWDPTLLPKPFPRFVPFPNKSSVPAYVDMDIIRHHSADTGPTSAVSESQDILTAIENEQWCHASGGNQHSFQGHCWRGPKKFTITRHHVCM